MCPRKTLEMRIDLTFRFAGCSQRKFATTRRMAGSARTLQSNSRYQALSAQTVNKETSDPHVAKLSFPLGQIVHIRYRVAQNWEGEIIPRRLIFSRAIQQRSFFQLTGA